MSEEIPFAEMIRALAEDSGYREQLTARIRARSIDSARLDRLVAYARSRQTTRGQAMTRRVLTDAGVSWEAR